MQAEEWRAIAEFPDYQVSSYGRVISLRRSEPRLMKLGHNHKGYQTVLLRDGSGRSHSRRVPRLVAAAFLGPCPDDQQVRHLDGDRGNNVVGNLAYGTTHDNAQDQRGHGTHHNVVKTHCPYGHPYSGANLFLRTTPRGMGRGCRACKADKTGARR